jgi:UDP-N-acetylglucosamine--N-acetylmuramyl-(pentapeptide) pyrophosphoryl-undecaprenol N-acetylglucosamine transferase
VSRAGASSISDLSLLGKSSILVPSPNVAEDHQTHNARALSDKGAAILVRDVEAVDVLVNTALETIASKEKLQSLSTFNFQLVLLVKLQKKYYICTHIIINNSQFSILNS